VPCVPAGGLDRNVPAFALSWSFFDRLVASFAVQLGKSPSIVVFRRRPGWVSEISADGTQEIRESTEVKDKLLVAGFTSDDQGEAFDTWRQWAIRFQPDHWPDSPDDGSEIIYSVSGQVHRLKRFSFRWTPNIEAIPLTRRFDAPEGNKPPLIVITGFLGSGKTTLLNQMVESKALGYHRFVAVIQNELGPVAVDSGLTDGACNLVEITEGCVCCNLSGDLAKAVQKVCTGYKPDLILLETTGMLDPRSLLEEIPRLAPYARFDSLVSLVDASTFFRVLDEYSVVKEQIAAADLIILNKIDLVPKRDIDRLKATVAAINPRADVIPAVRADVPPDLLFSTAVLDRVGNRQHPAMPVSHEEGTQGYDVVAPHTHLAVDNVITFTVRAPGQLDREKTLSFLSALPKSVYRLKGVLAFAGEEQPKLVQYVAGRYDIEDFPQADISPNVIVFIGRGMDCDHLREALTLCASEADLDEPRV
jgi:G3E family GTPase